MEFALGGYLAAGWIPFCLSLMLVVVFSWAYVAHMKHRRDWEPCASVVSMLAVSAALLLCALVPVDVFLVSFMKEPHGAFKTWATDPKLRHQVQHAVSIAYLALVSLVGLFCFLILPLAYFFCEEPSELDPRPGCCRRLCSACKYSLAFVVAAGLLVAAGLVLTLKGKDGQSVLFGDVDTRDVWNSAESMLRRLDMQKGEEVLALGACMLSLVGLVMCCVYTALGLSWWPLELVRGGHGRRHAREVRERRLAVREHLQVLRARFGGTAFEQQSSPIWPEPAGLPASWPKERWRLLRLEEEERLLHRWERRLTRATNSCCGRLLRLCRPCSLVLGLALYALALLVFVSLLLSNLDKGLHSMGCYSGYLLPRRTLPNPLDVLLQRLQRLFPIDYVLYALMLLFFLLCSLSGMARLGIRCFCIRLYVVKARGTHPQGLLLASLTLMLLSLGINLLLFGLCPEYTSFGSQVYVPPAANHSNHALSAGEQPRLVLPSPVRCHTNSPASHCSSTSFSYILKRHFFGAWYLGAMYYWTLWIFLLSTVIGSVFSLCCSQKGALPVDFLDENLDDLSTYTPTPSSSSESLDYQSMLPLAPTPVSRAHQQRLPSQPERF